MGQTSNGKTKPENQRGKDANPRYGLMLCTTDSQLTAFNYSATSPQGPLPVLMAAHRQRLERRRNFIVDYSPQCPHPHPLSIPELRVAWLFSWPDPNRFTESRAQKHPCRSKNRRFQRFLEAECREY